MQLVDAPKPASQAEYAAALERVCSPLRDHPGVLALWQIGSVGTPGISDLDLVVLFADDASFPGDIRTQLQPQDRYFVLHSPFGIALRDWGEARRYSFFHNYKLLWGQPPSAPEPTPLDPDDQRRLKRQIALEYLLRIFVSLTAETAYGIVRLRNLFLHAKAMLYDCEYLGLENGKFREAVLSLVDHRTRWFDARPTDQALRNCVLQLHRSLAEELGRQLQQSPICLPSRPGYRISRNMRFVPGLELKVDRKGFRLPSLLAPLGRSYFNLQHRLNRFDFQVPMRTHDLPEVIARAFTVREALEASRKRQFPSFLPLTSSYQFL